MNNFFSNALSGTMDVLGQIGAAINNPFLARQNAVGNYVAPPTLQSKIPNSITPTSEASFGGNAISTKPQVKSTTVSAPAATAVTPPAAYDNVTGLLTAYGKAVGLPEVNAPKGSLTSDTPFTITGDNATSKSLSGGMTANDVLTKRQQLENTYLQAYQDYAAAQTAERTGQLNDLSREQNALYSGDTTDFGLGLAGLVKNQDIIKQAARATETQGALLQAQGLEKAIGFTQQDFANQLQAAPELGNVQVTATGDVIGTQRDPRTGVVTPMNLGNIYNGTYTGTGSTGGFGATATGTGSYPLVDQYSAANGGRYINEADVPNQMQAIVKQQASLAGIRVLPAEDVSKIRSIDVTQSNLQQMQSSFEKISSSGLLGRLQGLTLNKLEEATQSNPDIAAFKVFRDTAINAIQALAGGSGSGFRLNQSEIETASSNLPEITDNRETGEAKMKLLQGFLDKWRSQLLPGSTQTTYQTAPSASAGQTGNPSVGWF